MASCCGSGDGRGAGVVKGSEPHDAVRATNRTRVPNRFAGSLLIGDLWGMSTVDRLLKSSEVPRWHPAAPRFSAALDHAEPDPVAGQNLHEFGRRVHDVDLVARLPGTSGTAPTRSSLAASSSSREAGPSGPSPRDRRWRPGAPAPPGPSIPPASPGSCECGGRRCTRCRCCRGSGPRPRRRGRVGGRRRGGHPTAREGMTRKWGGHWGNLPNVWAMKARNPRRTRYPLVRHLSVKTGETYQRMGLSWRSPTRPPAR